MIRKSYLISIGVEQYYDSSFGKVTYAEADAKSIAKAFRTLGLPDEKSKTLVGSMAARGVALQDIRNFAGLANVGDRIYLYYAGHGLSHNSQNYLTFFDSSKGQPETTCLKLNEVLAILESSRCKQIILFLDCCHSGLSMAGLRDATPAFDTSVLIYEHRSDIFLVGFSACSHNELSSPSNDYKHGIWTHHLLKVLQGKAEARVYDRGVVVSGKLQQYLQEKTSEDARAKFDPKRLQNPERFGKDNGDFIVFDVSKHFLVPEKQGILVKRVELFSIATGSISRLPGFVKGSHRVPKNRNRTTENFVHEIGYSLIEEEISRVSILAKKAFSYKLRQVPITEVGDGVGGVVCLDFDYQIQLDQSVEDPGEYVLKKKAFNFKIREGYSLAEIDSIMGQSVDSLLLVLENPPEIEQLIDTIETMDGTQVSVDYDPSDLSYCDITILNNGVTMRFSAAGIEIYSTVRLLPSEIMALTELGYNNLIRIPEIVPLRIE